MPLVLKVPLQEEGFHQGLQEVAGRAGQEGDREGLRQDEEVLPRYPRHCPHSGENSELIAGLM